MDTAASDPEKSLLQIARDKSLETGRDRLAAMRPQCGFGELGTCCRVCYLGPCRIDPFGDGPKTGVCGLSADGMVARNLLREAVGGAASHVGHARHLLLALRDALDGRAPYPIRGAERALALARAFGVPTEGRPAEEVCRALVDIALEDFGRQDGKTNAWLDKRAPPREREAWEKAGLAYSNPHNEIEAAMHASTMGNDADPMSLLTRLLRIGLVDGWSGLALCTDMQDVLFGTPRVASLESSAGVLEADSVNVAVHGHNPLLSEKVVEWAGELGKEAVAAGARRVNVVGVCCTGNELAMRHGVPMAAHNTQAELLIATGAVDCMVVDIQCIWPSLPQLAGCFDTAFVTTDEVAHIPGARHVQFEPSRADEGARQIVLAGIEAFTRRAGKRVDIPAARTRAVAGLSVEAIVGILSTVDAKDPLKPVIDSVAGGSILGFAGIIGCTNPKLRDGAMTEELVKHLLAADVLVVTTGCAAHVCAQAGLLTPEATARYCGAGLKAVLTAVGTAAGLGGPLPPVWHMGSCVDNSRIVDLLGAVAGRLGVKISQLPAAGSAPELVQEKAIAIGGFFLALGALVHVAPAPRVLGSPLVTRVLTQHLPAVTGGKVLVESDPRKAAAGMIAHIREKRAALGL